MNFVFDQLKTGEIGTNCYVFGDNNTKEVAVVDPGDEGEKIYKLIEKNNYNVKYILLTHGHFDHIGAVSYLKERTDAKILIHKFDCEMLTDPHQNLSIFVDSDNPIVQVKADKLLSGEQEFHIGNLKLKTMHTPGHTMGGMCILFENLLFSGDTLFKETVGRTDLPNASYSDIIKSVNKLMTLDDNTIVYPGHGSSSTIKHERENNPHFSKKFI